MTAYRSAVTAGDFEPDTRAFFAGKSVAVTGGSGFIGSHVVECLLELDARPIVPTRRDDPAFLRHLGGDVDIRRCDLADEKEVRAALEGATVVLSLAATVGGIAFNAAHPASIFQANMRPYLNVIDAAAAMKAERFLVTSSACVYARHCSIPTPEEEGFTEVPETTNAGYGWAKRMEEYLGAAYAEEHGLSVAIARPYNAYGPRDDFDPETSHVLPALILKALQSDDGTLPVWGDGTATRSFLYVDDFARGLLEIAARYPAADALNVGGEDETSIGEAAGLIADVVADVRGTPIKPVFDPGGLAGQPRRKCDTTRLKTELGFAPRVEFADGIRRTIEWFVEHEDYALPAHPQ